MEAFDDELRALKERVRKRAIERQAEAEAKAKAAEEEERKVCVCVCVCVCERERERERESVCVCLCWDAPVVSCLSRGSYGKLACFATRSTYP
jgi:hypothetical protein